MTDDEARALGLRAMACKGWEWRPGMLALSMEGCPGSGVVDHSDGSGLAPDLRDPATLGAFVDVVLEAERQRVESFAGPHPRLVLWAEYDSGEALYDGGEIVRAETEPRWTIQRSYQPGQSGYSLETATTAVVETATTAVEAWVASLERLCTDPRWTDARDEKTKRDVFGGGVP